MCVALIANRLSELGVARAALTPALDIGRSPRSATQASWRHERTRRVDKYGDETALAVVEHSSNSNGFTTPSSGTDTWSGTALRSRPSPKYWLPDTIRRIAAATVGGRSARRQSAGQQPRRLFGRVITFGDPDVTERESLSIGLRLGQLARRRGRVSGQLAVRSRTSKPVVDDATV